MVPGLTVIHEENNIWQTTKSCAPSKDVSCSSVAVMNSSRETRACVQPSLLIELTAGNTPYSCKRYGDFFFLPPRLFFLLSGSELARLSWKRVFLKSRIILVGASGSSPCYSCVVFRSGRLHLALVWINPPHRMEGGCVVCEGAAAVFPRVRAGATPGSGLAAAAAPLPPQRSSGEPHSFAPPFREVGWAPEGEAKARCGVSLGAEGRGWSCRQDEQALPQAPGEETRPASVLGKCSHGQKSRVLIGASYLHATQFKNRLHLNRKHVFGFVPILSSGFPLSALRLHQPLTELPGWDQKSPETPYVARIFV